MAEWHETSDRPRPGSRIVLVHGDRSGAACYYWDGETLFGADNPEDDSREWPEGDSIWIELPVGVRLYYEQWDYWVMRTNGKLASAMNTGFERQVG